MQQREVALQKAYVRVAVHGNGVEYPRHDRKSLRDRTRKHWHATFAVSTGLVVGASRSSRLKIQCRSSQLEVSVAPTSCTDIANELKAAAAAVGETSFNESQADAAFVALYAACKDGKLIRAKRLLQEQPVALHGAGMQPHHLERVAPLSWAVFYGWSELVELFLTDIQDVATCTDETIDHALAQAFKHGHITIAEMLSAYFPTMARATAARELSRACRSGREAVACHLIRHFPHQATGTLVNPDVLDSTTPLYWACRLGLLKVVRLLQDLCVDEVKRAAAIPDFGGRTPLAWACNEGHEGIVKSLMPALSSGTQGISPVPPPELDEIWEAEAMPMKTAPDNADARRMLQASKQPKLAHQGYRLIGSHSAVKQCRWTKNALRGQGQCYKHAFYGINSHGCMEGTPSLACANKCTFCWRNHANPVATSWAFQTDDPEYIVEESIRQHLAMIEDASISPLVRPDRLEEARSVRHMALSLVGEPVFYPRIGELIEELHKRQISTFLVTNGQFPEQLEMLPQVTQLYVSIDAPNAEELKRVGRPLFRDYWERLRGALSVLRAKRPRQRTVCRLTVLKPFGGNDALEGFANLIGLSDCDFVEVKGATYSGWQADDDGGLSMANVPWHDDVRDFALGLAEKLPGYSVACEHEHSCSVLLARRDRFLEPTGRWRTWIDFDAFAGAFAAGRQLDVLDFTRETPAWALADGWKEAGADTPGFDPADIRRRHRPLRPGRFGQQQEAGVITARA
jgi:tRNA wybutosine-synthesizing protein 1